MPVHVTVQFNLTAHLEKKKKQFVRGLVVIYSARVVFCFFLGTHDSLPLCRPNCCPAPSGAATHR